MSSPISRSSDPNLFSPYAPKWTRDKSAGDPSPPSKNRLPRAHTIDSKFGTQEIPQPPSLEPSLMPGEAMDEPWYQRKSQSFLPNHTFARKFLRLLIVISVFALIAYLVTVIFPVSRTIVAMRQAVIGSGDKLTDNVPASSAPAPSLGDKFATASSPKQSGSRTSNEEMANTHLQGAASGQAGMFPAASRSSPPMALAASSQGYPNVTADAPKPPSTVPTQPNVAAPAPRASRASAVAAVSVNTIPVKRTEEPKRSLGPDEINTLIKQGHEFVSEGDFASARLVFGRVAQAGNARGAFALAATYDPIALEKIRVGGAVPDIAKARQWYRKAEELGSRDASARLAALDDSVDRSASAQQPAITAATAKSALSSKPAGSTGSYWWERNGSILRLEASGPHRRFIYFKPSDAELRTGVQAGAVRFDGRLSEKTYSGTAYSYFGKCGRRAFQVKGQIENDGKRVALSGTSPEFDDNCHKVGKIDKTLVFDFVAPPTR